MLDRPGDQNAPKIVDDDRADYNTHCFDYPLTDDPAQPMFVEPFVDMRCVQ